MKVSRNKTNRWNLVNTTCLMNHSCSRFTDSRCSLRYLDSRKQQTMSSSSKTSQTTQEDVWDGWKRTRACRRSSERENVKATKTKRAEPFKEKMNWGTEAEIILRTEDFTPPSTRCWSNQPCLFNNDRIQAEQTADDHISVCGRIFIWWSWTLANR